METKTEHERVNGGLWQVARNNTTKCKCCIHLVGKSNRWLTCSISVIAKSVSLLLFSALKWTEIHITTGSYGCGSQSPLLHLLKSAIPLITTVKVNSATSFHICCTYCVLKRRTTRSHPAADWPTVHELIASLQFWSSFLSSTLINVLLVTLRAQWAIYIKRFRLNLFFSNLIPLHKPSFLLPHLDLCLLPVNAEVWGDE